MPERHDHDHCDLCKGASFHQTDHYALGRLRHKLCNSLALTYASTVAMPLAKLLAKHREAGHPRLAK